MLGIGAGSTALLAALDSDTSDSVIQAIVPGLHNYPNLNEGIIRRLVEETRATGFAVSRGNVVKNVLGIGMAIPKPGGIPSLALSIAALDTQTSSDVIPAWKRIINQEIETVLEA